MIVFFEFFELVGVVVFVELVEAVLLVEVVVFG